MGTRWFRHGDMEFEVDPGTPEFDHLLAAGAEPLVAPDGDTPAAENELSDKTVAELRELAAERGISHSGLNKAELVEALEAGPDADELGADE